MIQNRASDTAVQSDLKNIGQKFMEFQVTTGRIPGITTADLGPMGIAVAKILTVTITPQRLNGYNMTYCQGTTAETFALVAASKSGNVYVFKGGSVQVGVGPLVSWNTTCSNNAAGYSGIGWLFNNGSWHSSISG